MGWNTNLVKFQKISVMFFFAWLLAVSICLFVFICLSVWSDIDSAMTFRFQDKTEKKNANLSVIAIESIVGAPAQKYKEEQLGKVAGGNSPFSRPRPRGVPRP